MKSVLKKILIFSLALTLLLPFAACKKKPEEPGDNGGNSNPAIKTYTVNSGSVGESGLLWEILSDGTMYIRGEGEMPDFEYKSIEDSDLPWTAYLQGNVDNTLMIQKLVVEEGVTSISEKAFYGCKALTEVVLPKSLTEIGYSAFVNCRKLTRVGGGIGLLRIEEMAFQGCAALTTFSVSPKLTEIQTGAFSGCGTLTLLVTGNETEWKAALEKMIIGEGNSAFTEGKVRFYEVK